SFQNQLAALTTRLHAGKARQPIRVLLMHHSWHKRGLVLSIARASRAALEQFLVAERFQLILTGHTHEPLANNFTVPIAGATSILECRCGTTSQHDHVPYAWRGLLGNFPSRNWPMNSLL